MKLNNTETIIVAVSNTVERTETFKRIYNNLTKEPLTNILVKKKDNKILLYHKVDIDIQVLIRQYIIVIIPIIINTEVLKGFDGTATYKLDYVIDKLLHTVEQLQSLQGYKVTKGVNSGTTLRQLARCLRSTDGEY